MHNYSSLTNEHTINQNNKKCSDLGIHKKENDLFITEHPIKIYALRTKVWQFK